MYEFFPKLTIYISCYNSLVALVARNTLTWEEETFKSYFTPDLKINSEFSISFPKKWHLDSTLILRKAALYIKLKAQKRNSFRIIKSNILGLSLTSSWNPMLSWSSFNTILGSKYIIFNTWCQRHKIQILIHDQCINVLGNVDLVFWTQKIARGTGIQYSVNSVHRQSWYGALHQININSISHIIKA